MSQSTPTTATATPTTDSLVLEKSSNNSGLSIDLHPLCIINISDHYTRVKVESGSSNTRVIGVIQGIQNGRNVEIFNSFELVYTMVDGAMVLDFGYLKQKQEQFKKVFPTYDLLGWYSTGNKVTKDDLLIHKQILELNESPLYLMLDTVAVALQTTKDLPIVIYESELHIINDVPTTLFVKSPYKIQTGEAERIGVNHIAKVTPGGSEGSGLSTHLYSMHNAISMLNIRVNLLSQYLKAVKEKKVPYEHGILRQVASLCNQLPTISTQEFNNQFLQEYNDVLLVTYLASITRDSTLINDAIDKYLITHEKQTKRRFFM
ncbi:Mov34/MPN/PAD-1 family protein [Tieghemostelium lacteum]|uniref:COP9 signalosome complex subunit 6 n=1 Tax=Tieghemostelium lacteum TaxID=361077 RepID=A0A152A6C1_TIELA|nr:Mov34/MPN/PAD-1 family protein [Tieghemostelium lacteum]|eukprot:KYR01770.1 Mov34/MPN/PAD-1 family protein [Tieghemostelium lacteum]